MTVKPWGQLVGVRPSKLIHRLIDKGMDYNAAWQTMHKEHDLSREKFALLWRVAETERPVLLDSDNPYLFSVYVGIPFCPTRCLYCSFPSHSLEEAGKWQSQFVDALLLEIEAAGRQTQSLGMRPYSVYLGGGTPTTLSPGDLQRLFSKLRNAFPGNWREFTVEAGRPETLTDRHLEVFVKMGVDRVSVNPQTMHLATLRLIGRNHTPQDIVDAVLRVRSSGINVLNMDIIVGLPGEDATMAEETARQVVNLAPENITVHVFAPKRASRFREECQTFPLPPDTEAQQMHRAVIALCEERYNPYYLYRQNNILAGLENIGYTLPGKECAYNIVMIEERHHILGLGGGATSKFINPDHSLLNLANHKNVLFYLKNTDRLIKRREAALAKVMQQYK